jgi:hypothetical protein
MNPACAPGDNEILECLQALRDMDLVKFDGAQWVILDLTRDMVIPSKYSNEVGKRIIQNQLEMNANYIPLPIDQRMMRTVMTTVKKPESGNWVDVIRPLILGFQDDSLALQGSNDDTVISIFVSAVEVARK